MAQIKSYTVTATAGGSTYSPVYVPDFNQNPFSISLFVNVGTTARYTVQHTFTNPFETALTSAAAGVWLAHEFLSSVVSTSDDGNYAYPVMGIRLCVSAANTGTATLTIVQGHGTGS